MTSSSLLSVEGGRGGEERRGEGGEERRGREGGREEGGGRREEGGREGGREGGSMRVKDWAVATEQYPLRVEDDGGHKVEENVVAVCLLSLSGRRQREERGRERGREGGREKVNEARHHGDGHTCP